MVWQPVQKDIETKRSDGEKNAKQRKDRERKWIQANEMDNAEPVLLRISGGQNSLT